MRCSSVCIIGLSGLLAEVAKNVVLTGIGALHIIDDSVVTWADLGANFLLSEDDVGKNVLSFLPFVGCHLMSI